MCQELSVQLPPTLLFYILTLYAGEAKDLCCIAKCYKVPCPSESQANDTNSCVAACPQGTGTPADTEKYTNCQQNCFSSHFFPANGGAATTHTTSKTTAATGSSATQTNAEASGSKCTLTPSWDPGRYTVLTLFTASTNSASSTSGSASASATNAATNVKMSASGAGLFGLMLAAFAL